MNQLKSERSKTGVLTSFATGNDIFDLIANTVYHLHDILLEGISTKQWRTINVHMETNRQHLTAKKLRLNGIDRFQEFATRFLVADSGDAASDGARD